MIHGNFSNGLLKFIIAYCFFSILQLKVLATYGQDLPNSLDDKYSDEENELNLFNTSFPQSFEDTPTLRSRPDGEDEEDSEIIGIDKVPVSDALPFLLVLCGIYCLLSKRKENSNT